MGVFDFLKVTIYDKKPESRKKASGPAKNPGKPGAFLNVDSKSFPIAALSQKGVVVTGFDDSLIVGQKAHVTVSVNEPDFQLSISTAVLVSNISGDRMAAEFSVLPVETEKRLRQYAERKGRKR